MANEEVVKNDALTELLKLRVITERSGVLHEAQVLQLKYWPYVLWSIKNHTITVDDRKRILIFDLTFGKSVPKSLDQGAHTLEGWIWDILGKQYCIRLRNARNQKWLYKGARGDPKWTPPPAEHEEVQDYEIEGEDD